MKDPYINNNGVLLNKLNIENYDVLKQAEADISFVKLINIDSIPIDYFDEELIKRIHKHIFEDIYDWAGSFRKVPIYKEEIVLPRYSIPYTSPDKIEKELKQKLEELNSIDWKELNKKELSLLFARKIALIWKIHPFRDGNTRTTLSFACMFAKAKGFPFDIEPLLMELNREFYEDGKVKKYSIRDKIVLACLDDRDYPEVEPLAAVFYKAMNDYKSNKDNNVKK